MNLQPHRIIEFSCPLPGYLKVLPNQTHPAEARMSLCGEQPPAYSCEARATGIYYPESALLLNLVTNEFSQYLLFTYQNLSTLSKF